MPYDIETRRPDGATAAHDAAPVPGKTTLIPQLSAASTAGVEDEPEITVEEKSSKLSYAGGAGHWKRTRTEATTEGEHGHVDTRSTDTSLGKRGLGIDHLHEDEQREGEEAKVKTARGYGGTIGPGGVAARGKLEKEVELDGHKRVRGLDGSASIGKEGFEAEGARATRTEDEHGSHERKSSGAFKDEHLELGVSDTRENKDAGTSRAIDAKARVGLEGAGADASIARTHAGGAKTSASAGFDAGKEGTSAHAAATLTSKGGSSATLSISGGVKVYADKPVQVGDHWEVTYLRTTSANATLGGGTSMAGVGGSLGAGANEAHYESGIRSFESKKEADEFKEHAAEHVAAAVVDPGTIAGAMLIPIGEARGGGHTSSLSAKGALSVEGASIGGGVHSTTGSEIAIRRRSAQLFDVTITASGEKGAELAISGGITDTRARSSGGSWSVTWRFDVYTREGRAAFEKYCRDHLPPAGGGTLVSVERTSHAETSDHVHVAGLGDAEWKQGTAERHRADDRGTHDELTGTRSHDQDPSWLARHLGDTAQHSNASLSARMENGKEAGYTATVHVESGSGAYNRDELSKLTLDPTQKGAAKASGKWTLSADIDPKTIHALERDVSAFRGAHSEEERMRILTGLFAQNAQMLGGKASFDIELDGDPAFPGRAAREAIDQTIARLVRAITEHPAGAASVVTEAQHQLDALAARRAKVADRSKYTDLPDGLRAQQLAVIDRQVAGLNGVRHRALQESVKNRPGESIDAIHAREADPRAFAAMPPEERELARLRDRIADTDAQIARYYRDNGLATQAVDRGLRTASPGRGFGPAKAAARRADQIDDQQAAGNAAIETERVHLFTAAGHDRVTHAKTLLAMLEIKRHLADEMLKALYEAGLELRPLVTAGAMRGHEAFWSQFPSEEG